MLTHCERPMVFPLQPHRQLRGPAGRHLPLEPGAPSSPPAARSRTCIMRAGLSHRSGQQRLHLPWRGLAAIVSQIREISPDIFTTAAFAPRGVRERGGSRPGTVYLRISELRNISVHMATAVLKRYRAPDPSHPLHRSGSARAHPEPYVGAGLTCPIAGF